MPLRRTILAPAVLALTMCVSSTLVAAEDDLPRSVTINTLGYYQTSDGTTGGTMTPVTITANSNPTGRMRLCIFEDEIDRNGEMWRAAAWVFHVIPSDISGAALNHSRQRSILRSRLVPGFPDV
jgi:hypothetical protein